MNFLKVNLFVILAFIFTINVNAQNASRIKISGKIIDKEENAPLEYATVVFQSTTKADLIFGSITDEQGKFDFEVPAGTYNVKFEFISYKTVILLNQNYTENFNFKSVFLQADAAVLQELDLTAEVSTVEFKLDKKVYNIGRDMIVKGGTVSDVLDNIPSVTVDPDGTIALRGNENVTIFIDGKPSGLAGINVADALKILPADSIEKVEIISNPSARYNSEGNGGIINIILKKGKTSGLNGSVNASIGDPKSLGLGANLNYRSEKFNLFSNIGRNYRTSEGNSKTEAQYFNNLGNSSQYIYEQRNNSRINDGYNANFGIDYFITDNTSFTNSLTFQEETGENPEDVVFNNYDANFAPTFIRNRNNTNNSKEFSLEYATGFSHKFKGDSDHKLTVDASFSENRDNGSSIFDDQIVNDPSSQFTERSTNNQKQRRNLVQADYVLPIGKDARFEAGYRGSFQNNFTSFAIDSLASGIFVRNDFFSNDLEYVENINAFYAQYGSKFKKFSYFLGLRYEDSDIEVNSITENDYTKKKYSDFFPTATLNYDISDNSNVTFNYSKRLNRPRGRFLNPFSSYSSKINIFRGNPDLDPSYADVFEISYLKRFKKITVSSSIYHNITTNSFQFIRRESGLIYEGTPVIESTPINLANEFRSGFEFNINYNPFKWWRLNTNFNLYRNETEGDYNYTNTLNQVITQNFDNVATSWSTRISSKISLPYKIDWQTNMFYMAPQTTAQGKRLSMTSLNLAFSKDILKDKGSIALNVSDLLNSRKRRIETELPYVSSYSEYQWRQRQVTLAFTYRFNKKKEREKTRGYDGGSDEMMGSI